METKHYIGLILLLTGLVGVTGLACLSHRLRALTFFLLVAAAPVMDRFDINFVSREWYRGTTRGFEVSALDVLALAVLVSAVVRPRHAQAPRWFWPAGLLPLLAYTGYCGLTILFAEQKLFGMFEFSKLLRGLVVLLAAAFYVRGERELRLLVLALACAVFAEGALAFRERYLDGIHRAAGTLVHPNSLSMWLCLTAPVLVAAVTANIPAWLRLGALAAIGAAVIGMVLTVSRAGIPIFAMVMLATIAVCVSWRVTFKKLAVTALITASVMILIARSWDTLAARYRESTFTEEYLDTRTAGRGMYFRQARVIVEQQPLGVGLNNWSYAVSKTYGRQLGLDYRDYDRVRPTGDKNYASETFAPPAHNLAALTVGELGLPGLALFGLLWLRWFGLGAGFCWPRRSQLAMRLGIGIFFGLGGLFLQSLTEWTLRQTPIFFTFHILLGTLASLVFLKRREVRR